MCMKPLLYLFIIFQLSLMANCEMYVDNFKDDGNVSSWSEHSDTVRSEGKSKASFVLQKTGEYRRAILFTLLNPQSCGAAFAGIKKHVLLDLSKYTTISLRIRGQGQYSGYEFILRHKGDRGIEIPSYCHFFEAPSDFVEISLPLKDFKLHLNGIPLPNGEPLDKAHVTSIGILAYGGAHLPKKQFGAASLEIDWMKIH